MATDKQLDEATKTARRNGAFLKRKFGFEDDELATLPEADIANAVSSSLTQARTEGDDDKALASLGLDVEACDENTGEAYYDREMKAAIARREQYRAEHAAAMSDPDEDDSEAAGEAEVRDIEGSQQ